MIEIFVAVDDNYKDHWRPVYNSIKANTKEKISFNIICESNVQISTPLPDVHVIHVIPEITTRKKFNFKPTRAIYLRWMIPELTDSDKAIYLDIDLVVTGDIKELWDVELGDNYVAAVESYIFNNVDEGSFIQGKCPGSAVRSYLSGQMVINCKKWREDSIKKALTSFVIEHDVLDEAPISIICKGKIKELSRYWCVPANYVTRDWAHPRMKFYYNLDNAKLWHWSSAKKPWLGEVKNDEIYRRYC